MSNSFADDFLGALSPERWFKTTWPKMKLYKYQSDFINDQSRYRIVDKSRQTGFTFITSREAIYKALARPNRTILIISVSDRQAHHVIKYVEEALAEMEKPPQLVYDTKSIKTFTNGSRIIALPNSPSTVRGYPADDIYIDENAHIKNDRSMEQAIVPSTSRGGTVTRVSTPMGKRGIFWSVWEKAEELEYSKHFVPWKECPDLDIATIKKQFGEMDEITFRQEFEGEFVDEAVSFFPYDVIMKGVNHELEMVADSTELVGHEESTFYAGVDFAKIRDETVITVMERKPGGRFVARLIHVFSATPYKTQLLFIKSLQARFPLVRLYFDMTGVGVRLNEDLSDSMGHIAVGINFSSQSKEKMITELRILFEQERIEIPENQYLIAQLHQLERTETGGGVTRYRHAEGKHDDAVWSLALACFAGSYFQDGDADVGVAMNRSKPTGLAERTLFDIDNQFSTRIDSPPWNGGGYYGT